MADVGKVIVIGGQKGGPGKSTLGQNLAVYFNQIHNKEVYLLDADPQQTTMDWLNERKANSSVNNDIIGSKADGDIEDLVKSLANKYDIVVVDTGGMDGYELRGGIAAADICIFPLRPKRRDLKTLKHVSVALASPRKFNKKCKYFSVLTQCPSQANQQYRVENAKAICSDFGLTPFLAVTEVRNIYDDCDEGGKSILETSDSKAIAEIMAIGNELIIKGEFNGYEEFQAELQRSEAETC